MSAMVKDIFVCHASEDKNTVVRPVVNALEDAGISCWFDEAEIRWGDSITEKVNHGMQTSTYVMVVLSRAFLRKKWPQREMNAALNKEATSGEVRVLPLLIDGEEKESILQHYPLLNDKSYLLWEGNFEPIVTAMRLRLQRRDNTLAIKPKKRMQEPNPKIPLPKVKKKFSQRDKDQFLQNSFTAIQKYFEAALWQLQKEIPEIETDIAPVHTKKFLCTVYIRGEVANRCKIWIGGFHSSDSIAYFEGEGNIDSDSTMNDWLTVREDNYSLGFESSGMSWHQNYPDKKMLTRDQAAEYLWVRFTERLT